MIAGFVWVVTLFAGSSCCPAANVTYVTFSPGGFVVPIEVEPVSECYRLGDGDQFERLELALTGLGPALPEGGDERRIRTEIEKYPTEWRELAAKPQSLMRTPAGRPRSRFNVAPGRYVVVGGDDRRPRIIAVRSFSLLVFGHDDGLTVIATGLDVREPAAGISVSLHRVGGEILTARTDATGRADLRYQQRADGDQLIARRGDDVRSIEVGALEESPRDSVRVFLSTDRPVYKPGDRVHFKGIVRETDGPQLAVPRLDSVEVGMVEEDRERTLVRVTCELSDAGTFSGSFRIAPESAAGARSLEVLGARLRFEVRPYRKPEFRTKCTVDRSGESPRLILGAEYLFGGPVANAHAFGSIERDTSPEQLLRRPFAYPRAEFDDPYQGCLDVRPLVDSGLVPSLELEGLNWLTGRDDELWDDPDDSWEVVGEFDGGFDSSGQLDVTPTAGLEAGLYRVETWVEDDSGFHDESTMIVDLRPSRYRLQPGCDRLYAIVGESALAKCRVLDERGIPAADVELHFALMTRIEVGDPDDPLVEWEWVAGGVVLTDSAGVASMTVTPQTAGPLRLRARLANDRTNVARVDVPVFDLRGETPANHEQNEALELDDDLSIWTDHRGYVPGATMRLVVESRFQGAAWIVADHGSFELLRRVELKLGANLIELPYRREWGASVHLGVISGAPGHHERSFCTVFADPSERHLDVGVAFDRDEYRPGETATVTLTTRFSDTAVPAEIEFAIVDDSIFQLVPQTPMDPKFFFGLPTKLGDQWESTLNGNDGSIGIGEALLMDEGSWITLGGEPEARLRSQFVDTWEWQPAVQTDADGQCVLQITGPDDLTTWRVVARAVSGADRFGLAVSEVRTRQPLFARLIVADPLREGDETVVSAIVHSHLDVAGTFEGSFVFDGSIEPISTDAMTRTLSLSPGESKRVDLRVRCVRPGEARIEFSVAGDLGRDRIEIRRDVQTQRINVIRSLTASLREPSEHAFVVPEDAIASSVDITLEMNRSAHEAIATVLPGLAAYPYGCVEQTMSRFLPCLVARTAAQRMGGGIDLPPGLDGMIESGLLRLYHFQHESGGWGWWRNDDTDSAMTRYVLGGLLIARDSGVVVVDRVVRRALESLSGMPSDAPDSWLLSMARRQGFLDPPPADPNSVLDIDATDYGKAIVALNSTLDDRLESEVLQGDASEVAGICYLVLAGRTRAAARIPIDLPTKYGSAEIVDVALRLRAIASVDLSDSRVTRLIDWLLAARRFGGWTNTLDTAHAVYALSLFARSPEERSEIEFAWNGERRVSTESRVALSGDSTGPGRHRLHLFSPKRTPRAGEFPVPSVTATVRYQTREGLDHPSSTMETLWVRRVIEREVVTDGASEWKAIEPFEPVALGTLLRFVFEANSPQRLQYFLVESPLVGGVSPAGHPEEDDTTAERFADRVTFGSSRFQGGYRDYHVVRATRPGLYVLPPMRLFGMYDPSVEARTSVFQLRIVDL